MASRNVICRLRFDPITAQPEKDMGRSSARKYNILGMQSFKPCTHVIFDLDGLLLDTEVLYTKAIQSIASEYDKVYPFEVKVKCMGKKMENAAEIIINDLELPITVPEYIEKFDKKQIKLMPTAQMLPGAERLVKHLHKHNIPMAIASGCARESFDLKSRNHGDFFALFDHFVFASSDPEVRAGKPNPDIFTVCAKRFPQNPSFDECLVFEDAPNGVAAGVSAGMQVVMVPDPRLDKTLTQGASLVLDSLQQFQPELFALPPFDS